MDVGSPDATDQAPPPEATDTDMNEDAADDMMDASVGSDQASQAQQGTADGTPADHEEPRTADQKPRSGATGLDQQEGDPDNATERGAPSDSTQQKQLNTSEDQKVPSPEVSNERSRGDTLERWSRQLKAIDEALSGEERGDPAAREFSEAQEVAHVGAEDLHDAQALAAAEAVEAVKLRDLQEEDGDQHTIDGAREPDADMDASAGLDAPITTIDLEASSHLPLPADGRSEPPILKAEADSGDGSDMAIDPQVTTDQVRKTEEEALGRLQFIHARSKLNAAEAWQQYSLSVRELSFSLTEQLRLILEPTQASRLEGDYRSGKRLNMKRLIPYIASEYTKDKIWLRRTKPFDRRYQIMLALDDSQSMSDPTTVHLAFQALALVSSSLSRLEVGQVAVASFGEQVSVVHPFEAGPITEEAGQRMLERFTFQQTKTDYATLLKRSLFEFTTARERTQMGAAQNEELWQLQIIISDGLTSSNEQVAALLRKAREAKVSTLR